MERTVRVSAKGIVIRNGCLLAVRMHDADGDFYILPGGGQNAGELLQAAMEREIAEETGMQVRAGDCVFVIEGAGGEAHHRVDLVFLCEVTGESDLPRHPDSNQTGYDWLEIEDLNLKPLYPSRLRRAIMHLTEGNAHPVYLGNENMGDPEITD